MIRGFCPGLYTPMRSGDGLLVRVKPPGGRLRQAQALALAGAAERGGNGAIDLTSRGALQVRGLTEATAAAFAAACAAAGLGSDDPAAERRRSVVPTPVPAADAVTAALEAALAAAPGLDGLPAKFCVAVDAGGPPPPDGVDIVLEVGAGLRLRAGGLVADAPSIQAVVALAAALLRVAGPGRRMREADAGAVFRAAGLTPAPALAPRPRAACVGTLGPGVVAAGLPFGSLDAARLRLLVGVAAAHGDGVVRPTPFRSVAFGGVRDAAAALAALARLGLPVSPDDARLRVSACVGAPRCAAASVATRPLAARLRPAGAVHVSGCSKGCAHPGPAAITLVGRDGAFDLVRAGRAGDAPVRRGLSTAEAMHAVQL